MLKIRNNMNAQPVLGVLFDLDGVVIDTEKLYTRFWREAAEELGHPMTLEQALQMRSLGTLASSPAERPASLRA